MYSRRSHLHFHIEQKNETRIGTLKSVTTPLTIAAGSILSPVNLTITGRQTSTAVTPADAMGANGPNHLPSSGVQIMVNISVVSVFDVGCGGLGDAFAVEGCGDDAAGISGAFACGEEPRYLGMHERLGIAGDPYRG